MVHEYRCGGVTQTDLYSFCTEEENESNNKIDISSQTFFFVFFFCIILTKSDSQKMTKLQNCNTYCMGKRLSSIYTSSIIFFLVTYRKPIGS